MNKLRAMTAFRRVAELGSFSAAAADLRISNAAVSNYVSQLEAELGATLLVRSTRHLALSEIGQAYLPRVQAILDEIDETEAAARGLQSTPHGRLHVSAPATFGMLHVAPCIPAFAERHPELVLDLSFNDRVVDLVDEQVHVALRIGSGLPDSSLVARALMPIERVVCAAPAYLERHGAPTTPADLARHNCLTFKHSDSRYSWPLGGERQPVSGSITADSSIALREAALAGAGILLAPRFLTAPEIHAGRLVPLLRDCPVEAHTLYAVFPPGARSPTKVRLFLDHLMGFLGDPPRWEAGGGQAPSPSAGSATSAPASQSIL
ncbi:LysR family transcriptional regulator [Actibacterium sp. MT2.3-13A]|uniref:LysR family transcriptional regulator n=1 Tax=Actibacterium sp. MT2.3-13A TaxID=2828332 RepID=UPI001BA95D6D|nr:LysR family transcriptional regulator [Actibacterium sp. MT2.3-13A]